MIGNLRRDVEAKAPQDACKHGASTPSERRFQPPKRRQAAAVGRSNCSTPSKTTTAANPAKVSQAPQEQCTARPQSVEITWLMRTCQRMDDEASEVADFLSRHGFDRHAKALVNASSGIGASLSSLMDADEASLAEVGFTDAEQQMLRTALQQKFGHESRPSTRQSINFVEDAGAAGPKVSAWAKLGAPPPGWARVAENKPAREKAKKVVLVDSCVGGEDSVEGDFSGPEPDDSQCYAHRVQETQGDGKTYLKLSASALHEGETTPATTRPPTASSLGTVHTPSMGTRRTGDPKACCYQCFRQVHLQHAVVVDVDTADGAAKRHFCSEACAGSFTQATAARTQRVQELRAKVLGEPG